MRAWATAFVAITLTSSAASAQPAPSPDAVEWRIVVDDLHLDFTDTGRLRAFLSAVVDEALGRGEHVSLWSTGPSGVRLASTVDATSLRSAIRAVTGNGLKETDAALALTSERGDRRGELARRTRASLAALRQCLEEPAAISAVVLIVSNGFPRSPAATPSFDEVTAAARRRGVRILAADARDPARILPPPPPDVEPAISNLRASEAESLRSLSSPTGGATAHGLADTLAAMAALHR